MPSVGLDYLSIESQGIHLTAVDALSLETVCGLQECVELSKQVSMPPFTIEFVRDYTHERLLSTDFSDESDVTVRTEK